MLRPSPFSSWAPTTFGSRKASSCFLALFIQTLLDFLLGLFLEELSMASFCHLMIPLCPTGAGPGIKQHSHPCPFNLSSKPLWFAALNLSMWWLVHGFHPVLCSKLHKTKWIRISSSCFRVLYMVYLNSVAQMGKESNFPSHPGTLYGAMFILEHELDKIQDPWF